MTRNISLFIFFNIILSWFMGQVSCTLSADLHLDMIDTSNFKITKLKNHFDAYLVTPNKKINDVLINEKPVWVKTERSECVSATIYNTDKQSVIISLRIRENNLESVLIYEGSEKLIVDTGVCFSTVAINKPEAPKVPTKCGEKADADGATPSKEPAKDEKDQQGASPAPPAPPASASPAAQATAVKEGETSTGTQTGASEPPVESAPATSPTTKPSETDEGKFKDMGTSTEELTAQPAKSEGPESPEAKADKAKAAEATPVSQPGAEITPFHLDISEDIDKVFVNFYEKRSADIELNVYESTPTRLISSVHDGTNLVALARRGHFQHVQLHKIAGEPLLLFLTDGSEELFYMKEKAWIRVDQRIYAEKFGGLQLDRVRDCPEQPADRHTIDLNALFRAKARQALNASFCNNFVFVLRPQPLDAAVGEPKTPADSAAKTGEQTPAPVKTARTLIVTHVEASSGSRANAATNTESTRDASTNTAFGLARGPVETAEKATMTDELDFADCSAPDAKPKQQAAPAEARRFKSVGTMTAEASAQRATTTTGTGTLAPKYTVTHNGRPIAQVEAEITELSVIRLNNRNVYLEIATRLDGLRGPSVYLKKVHFSGVWMRKNQAFFAKDLRNSVNEFARDSAPRLVGAAEAGPESARPYVDLFAPGEASPANELSPDLLCKLRPQAIPEAAAPASDEGAEPATEAGKQPPNKHEEKGAPAKKTFAKPPTEDQKPEKAASTAAEADKSAAAKKEPAAPEEEEDDDDEDGFGLPGLGLAVISLLFLSSNF